VEALRTWILGLAGAAVFCAVCTELTPQGSVKSVQKMLCGVVMTLALVSPLLKLDMGKYSLNLARYRQAAEEIGASAEEISDSLSRTFIAEKCAAYILDKARLSGAEVTDAVVSVRWSGEGVWYPVSAEIYGIYNRTLSEKIEEELGISEENQRWIEDENS
jgi:hypothetical protein